MAERVVRNVENDYLMCSICLGRYKDPRLLPCGHSFCLQCLEDHIKQTVTDPAATHFKCPNDRTEIGNPASGMPARHWATAFPVDTFLGSLLSAVMIHASSEEAGETRDASCEQHKKRIKEFYCLSCGVTACAYCIVKSHKGNTCECVGIDEAVDRVRPICDHFHKTLEKQVQFARKLQRGEETGNGNTTRTTNKEKALSDLTDVETKLTFYYQTARRQIQDIRNTIAEAGKTALKENAQISAIVGNINDTIGKFDQTCNDGSGIEILNILPKIEGQVREYDKALKTLSTQAPAMDIYFVVNRQTEKVFENPPALGSVVVQSPGQHRERDGYSRHSNHSMMPMTPRYLDSSRLQQTRPESVASIMSDLQQLATPRTERTPTRPKVTISVKIADQLNNTWQLTGVVLIGHSVIIIDAHNGQLFKFDTRPAGLMPEKLAIECPVSVTTGHEGADCMITQPEQSKLSRVDTTDELTIAEELDTPKPYEGIAKLPGGQYVVSCCIIGQQCIDIIDGRATILKTIEKNENGQMLFCWPRFTSSTPDGDILVSDRDRHALLCITSDGRLKWTFKAQSSPWGVACHESGSIYLCLDSNEILVLNGEGRMLENKFVSRRDGIKVPYAIHAQGDFIAVSEWGSNLFAPYSSKVYMFVTN